MQVHTERFAPGCAVFVAEAQQAIQHEPILRKVGLGACPAQPAVGHAVLQVLVAAVGSVSLSDCCLMHSAVL